MSVFGSYYKYIFLFFTLKFQISKKIVFEIWNILYENNKEKLLWFNAFFAKFVKIYTHKLFDFLTFFQFNSRNNFLDSKKLFLRTLFFSMKHCLQNFPVYSFLGHFFGHDIIYLTIRECLFLQKLTPGTPLARVIILRFTNFSASKSLFPENFYLYDTGS